MKTIESALRITQDRFMQLLGLRNIKLHKCLMPEDLYIASFGKNMYLKRCKEQNIKPSPFTLSLANN